MRGSHKHAIVGARQHREHALVQTTVTGIFLTWNSARYVLSALDSVLAQSWPMQLIISDDGSSDATWELVMGRLRQYRGIHRIQTRRGARNLGLSAHRAALQPLCEGEIIVYFDADDYSLPNRVATLVAEFDRAGPSLKLLASSCERIDAIGNMLPTAVYPRAFIADIHDYAHHRAGSIFGGALAFRRELFDRFGPLPTGVHAEDFLLKYRAMLCGSIACLEDRLVHYRLHDANLTHDWLIDAAPQNLQTLRRQLQLRAATDAGLLREFERCLAQQRGSLNAAQRRSAQRILGELRRPVARARFLLDPNWRHLCGLLKAAWQHPRTIAPTALRTVLAVGLPQIYFGTARTGVEAAQRI